MCDVSTPQESMMPTSSRPAPPEANATYRKDTTLLFAAASYLPLIGDSVWKCGWSATSGTKCAKKAAAPQSVRHTSPQRHKRAKQVVAVRAESNSCRISNARRANTRRNATPPRREKKPNSFPLFFFTSACSSRSFSTSYERCFSQLRHEAVKACGAKPLKHGPCAIWTFEARFSSTGRGMIEAFAIAGNARKLYNK